MYIREKDGIIYIYRNQALFLNSLSGPYSSVGIQMMYLADYAIEVSRDASKMGVRPEPERLCRIVKDRPGTFGQNAIIDLKKIMKTIEFLYEDEEKIV